MVKTTAVVVLSTIVAIGAGALFLPGTVEADGFGPMNMMNPGRWFGGRDRYDDDYYGRGGYPPPPPGYGAPPPRYGTSAYAPPASVAPAAAAPAPDTAHQAHLRELENRIRELEARRQQSAPSYSDGRRPNPMERYDPDDNYAPPVRSVYQSPPSAGVGGMNSGYQPPNREHVSQTAPGNSYNSAAPPVFRPTD